MKIIFQHRDLALLFLSTFLFFCNEAMFMPTLPLHLVQSGFSNLQIGIIQGVFALGVFCLRPLAGWVTDRKSRKLSLTIGVLVFTAAPLLYLLPAQFLLLLGVRFFHGMGITFYTTAYPTLVTDICPVHRRGEVLGHMATAVTLAFTLAPLTGVMLYNHLGFFILIPACTFLGMVNLLVICRVQQDRRGLLKDTVKMPYRALLTHRSVVVASGIQMVYAMYFGAIMTFLPILLAENGLNAGIYFLVESIAIISCRLLVARLSDRQGRGPVFFYSFVLVLCAVFMLSKVTTVSLLVLTAAMFGTGSAMTTPSLSAFMADETQPEVRGMVYGIFYGAFDVGVIIAGLVMGYVAEISSIPEMFVWSAAAGAVCLVLFSVLIRPGVAASLKWTLVGERPGK